MHVEHIKGDLFSSDPTASLAHCISADCSLGKGVALIFKQKFGGIDELKKQVSGGVSVGNIAYLERDGRYIYNLITKERARDKPTYDTLQNSLAAMSMHAVQKGVKKICMPKIGCGLDGLNWVKVEKMLNEVFVETELDIEVYTL